jgi:hypothetical protein
LQKGNQILVSEQCKVKIQIGSYKDEILCDFMPMDVYRVFWGRLCKYDRKEMHGGRNNTYTLENNGHKHVILPLKDEGTKEEVGPSIILMNGKELLQEVRKEEEVQFVVVGKPRVVLTSKTINDLPIEI